MTNEAVIGYAMLAAKKMIPELTIEQLDALNSLIFYELQGTSEDDAEIACSDY